MEHIQRATFSLPGSISIWLPAGKWERVASAKRHCEAAGSSCSLSGSSLLLGLIPLTWLGGASLTGGTRRAGQSPTAGNLPNPCLNLTVRPRQADQFSGDRGVKIQFQLPFSLKHGRLATILSVRDKALTGQIIHRNPYINLHVTTSSSEPDGELGWVTSVATAALNPGKATMLADSIQ